MADKAYTVTRMPGAPPRRAGREWPEGETVEVRLGAAEANAVNADPGYAITPVAAPAPTAPAKRPTRRAKAAT